LTAIAAQNTSGRGCPGCGYSLDSAPVGKPCPECGAPVPAPGPVPLPDDDAGHRHPLREIMIVAAPSVATTTSYTLMQFVDGLMV
jgi:hypothetical protein